MRVRLVAERLSAPEVARHSNSSNNINIFTFNTEVLLVDSNYYLFIKINNYKDYSNPLQEALPNNRQEEPNNQQEEPA